jgi:hypothetical protein
LYYNGMQVHFHLLPEGMGFAKLSL